MKHYPYWLRQLVKISAFSQIACAEAAHRHPQGRGARCRFISAAKRAFSASMVLPWKSYRHLSRAGADLFSTACSFSLPAQPDFFILASTAPCMSVSLCGIIPRLTSPVEWKIKDLKELKGRKIAAVLYILFMFPRSDSTRAAMCRSCAYLGWLLGSPRERRVPEPRRPSLSLHFKVGRKLRATVRPPAAEYRALRREQEQRCEKLSARAFNDS